MKRSISTILLILYLFSGYSQQDMTKPFKDCGLKGSITIYDYNSKKWISSDIKDSHYATLPASTFKIINTLIAFESGIIEDKNQIVPWPGSTDTIMYGYRPNIYHDMNIKEAFSKSAGWVYVELAKRLGKAKYEEYLRESNYGNVDLSIEGTDFWNFGNFAISPINQIEILQGVYEETLPFSKENFNILKEMMIVEQKRSYTIRAKTGWTRDGGKDIGWWVGYVERDENAYFFATRLIKEREEINPEFGRCRKEITKKILRQMKIIE